MRKLVAAMNLMRDGSCDNNKNTADGDLARGKKMEKILQMAE